MENFFRSVLEGRCGAGGIVLRAALAPLGILYGLAGAARAAAYRYGLAPSHQAGAPVISVGNLTVGGTGKTPFTLMLCRLLRELGRQPAILTRGYGAAVPAAADEVKLFRRLLPEVEVHAGADRVAAATAAVAAGADVLVLDDGFQHLRLRRDLDIVLVDVACPFGGGWPLPAGLLREFAGSLARADLVCLTRCRSAGEKEVRELAEKIRRRFPQLPLLHSRHAPARLATLAGAEKDLGTLRGLRVVAVSGIGRPEAFGQTLIDLGAEVVDTLVFPDHHRYRRDDVRVAELAAATRSATLVTTEKDAVKLASLPASENPGDFLVLGIDLEVEDAAPLVERVRAALGTPA